MVFLRKYDKEFLKDLFKREMNFRYGLFEKLEEFIINSPSEEWHLLSSGKDNISTDVEAYRTFLDLPRKFPYWEIHWFKEYHNPGVGVGKETPPDRDQSHFYFTLKSLLLKTVADDTAFKDWLQPRSVVVSGLLEHKFDIYKDIKVARPYRKIDRDYTGNSDDQDKYGIDLCVFDDIANPSLKIEDLVTAPAPDPITNVFTDSDKKLLDIEIKDLPMVMYLSQGSKFNSKSKDPENTIVVLDRFTSINTHGDGSINGSIYMHEESGIYPLSQSGINIGKNIVIGYGSKIASRHIGDNVLIGNRVRSDRESKIRDNVFIEDDVVINEEQIIPAGQTVTAIPPLIMGVFSIYDRYNYDDFKFKLDILEKEYEEGKLRPFQQ